MELILEIQTDEYWQNVTTDILETARKLLRGLVKLIEKSARKIVFTDFKDEMGTENVVELPGLGNDFDWCF